MLQEMIDKFKENNPNKQLVLLFEAGSHFFDLNGPNSDRDYRGLYIDPHQDSFESAKKIYQVDYKTKIGEGKNSKDDVDFTLFSLSSFFKLLAGGDFNMQEMLFTPESKIIFKTPIYDELVSIRRDLLVNDTTAFLSFIRKEYKRYGVNINHYKLQEDFLNFIGQWPSHHRLKDYWNEILEYGKDINGIRFVETKICNSGQTKMIPTINIAERDHQWTASIKYVSEAIGTVLSRYGHRQKNMAESGVEFKGLYHALRLIYEANDLLDYGEFKLPFNKERHEILWNIKSGKVDKDYVFNLVDDEIEKLYIREKETLSNRRRVEKEIMKLECALRGRLSVQGMISSLSKK